MTTSPLGRAEIRRRPCNVRRSSEGSSDARTASRSRRNGCSQPLKHVLPLAPDPRRRDFSRHRRSAGAQWLQHGSTSGCRRGAGTPAHNPLGDTRQAEADIHAPQRDRPRGPPAPRRSSGSTGQSASASIHSILHDRGASPPASLTVLCCHLRPRPRSGESRSPHTRAVYRSDRRRRARTPRQEFHDSRSSSPSSRV